MEMRLRAPVTRGYFFSPPRFAPHKRGFAAKYRSKKNRVVSHIPGTEIVNHYTGN